VMRLGGVFESDAPDVAVAKQVSGDRRCHRAGNHRPAYSRPETNKHACGNPGCRPEHRDAIGLGEEKKTQARRQEIGDAQRDRQAD